MRGATNIRIGTLRSAEVHLPPACAPAAVFAKDTQLQSPAPAAGTRAHRHRTPAAFGEELLFSSGRGAAGIGHGDVDSTSIAAGAIAPPLAAALALRCACLRLSRSP